MPWNKISDVPDQVRTHDDAKLTLAQANKWASIYDAIKNDPGIDNPFAVAWGTFKRIYRKEGDKWIKIKKMENKMLDVFRTLQ